MTLTNNRASLLCYFKLCVSFCTHWWIQIGVRSYSPETPNLGPIRWFLEPCDLEIWWMTLKNNRAPLLCYFKLCAAFHCHQWSYSPKMPNSGQNRQYFHSVTLKFDLWPWKTNRAPLLCYFKLCALLHNHWWIQTEVQVRKRPIWDKSTIFRAVWPCN